MSYTHGANGISNAAGEYTSTPPLALVLALSLLLSLHLFISSSLHLETQRYFWSQTDVQGRISSDPFGNVLLRACILKVHTHTSASRFMLTSACCSFLMVLPRLFWGGFFFHKKRTTPCHLGHVYQRQGRPRGRYVPLGVDCWPVWGVRRVGCVGFARGPYGWKEADKRDNGPCTKPRPHRHFIHSRTLAGCHGPSVNGFHGDAHHQHLLSSR